MLNSVYTPKLLCKLPFTLLRTNLVTPLVEKQFLFFFFELPIKAKKYLNFY